MSIVFFTFLSKRGRIIFTEHFWFGRKKIVNVGVTSWHRRDCDRGDLDRYSCVGDPVSESVGINQVSKSPLDFWVSQKDSYMFGWLI